MSRALRQLCDWLDSLPDQDLQELGSRGDASRSQRITSLEVNLATLAGLSRINKREWIELIKRHGFPIELRARDASRDIIGKLLKFLEKEPRALEYLQRRSRSEISRSPELSRALSALLDYRG